MDPTIVLNVFGMLLYIVNFTLIALNWKKFPNKYFLFSFLNICITPFSEMLQGIPGLDFSDYIISIYAGDYSSSVDRFMWHKYENFCRRMAHCYLALDRAYAVHYYGSYDKLAFIYLGALLVVLPVPVIPGFTHDVVSFNVSGMNQTIVNEAVTTAAGTYTSVMSLIVVGVIAFIYLMIIKQMRQLSSQQSAASSQGISKAEHTAVLQSGTISLFQIHYAVYRAMMYFYDLTSPTAKLYREIAEWMELICPPFIFFGFSTTLRRFITPKMCKKKLGMAQTTVAPFEFRTAPAVQTTTHM